MVDLIDAVKYNNFELVKILIEAGADVHGDDGYCKRTPLHYACRNGNAEIAKFLIGKGAKVNAKDRDGGTPLHDACEPQYIELAKFLIKKGADIKPKDRDGRTPLSYIEDAATTIYILNKD
jgi:ankyrin repeat protein